MLDKGVFRPMLTRLLSKAAPRPPREAGAARVAGFDPLCNSRYAFIFLTDSGISNLSRLGLYFVRIGTLTRS